MYVQVLALILRDCACIPIYLSSYIGADPPGLCFHMFTRIGADPPGLCRDIFVRIGADSPRLYLHMHTQKHSNIYGPCLLNIVQNSSNIERSL